MSDPDVRELFLQAIGHCCIERSPTASTANSPVDRADTTSLSTRCPAEPALVEPAHHPNIAVRRKSSCGIVL